MRGSPLKKHLVSVALAGALVAACSSSSSSSQGTSCGTGTHLEAGVCELDAAYALTNPQNLGAGAYWRCLDSAGSSVAFALQLEQGTGAYLDLHVNAATLQSFTWTLGATTDSVLITSNTPAGVPFAELLSIVPTPVVYPTAATFTLDMAGNPAVSCTVAIGSIAKATCVPVYPDCGTCPGWVSGGGQCSQTAPP